MKEIPLTQGKVAFVDDEDYERLSKFNWYAKKCGRRYFYATRHDYSNGRDNGKTVFMHREILFAPKDKKVDHIDHDTLDNRKHNLRLCSHTENMRNSVRRTNNKSGYKGVVAEQCGKKWRSQICINGKHCHLGTFKTPLEASQAYKEAAIKHHGEFARY